MIEVKKLAKYYGDKPGVFDVSFTIDQGITVGLVGPNGAGKTTIMKMLAGYMLPSAGSIFIDNINAVENPKEASRRIGFMPEVPPLYPEMEVNAYLSFIAEIKGVSSKTRANHIQEIMNMADISHVKNRLIKNLSKGYRQRVGLAQALVGFPPVLILDEPTAGLDPKQINEVRKLIENLKQNHTIILSSHILSEIKMTCQRVIMISGGRLILEDTVENLEDGGKRFTIRVKGNPGKVRNILAATAGVSDIEQIVGQSGETVGYCRFIVNGQAGPAQREQIFRQFAAADLPIIELHTIGNALEDVFIELTTQHNTGAQEA
jgi:ABC-2 type transport system ATP-binding protein